MAIRVKCACGHEFRALETLKGKSVGCTHCGLEMLIEGERVPDFDVFVSHSKKDKHVADAVVAYLERKHIRCWIAPRDIIPGTNWGQAIMSAINDVDVMILVFSSNANTSKHVVREVEAAINKGVDVLPMRVDSATPAESLEFFIKIAHWMDAVTPPLESHLRPLRRAVLALLRARREGGLTSQSTTVPRRARPARFSRRAAAVAVGTVVGLASIATLATRSYLRGADQNAPEQSSRAMPPDDGGSANKQPGASALGPLVSIAEAFEAYRDGRELAVVQRPVEWVGRLESAVVVGGLTKLTIAVDNPEPKPAQPPDSIPADAKPIPPGASTAIPPPESLPPDSPVNAAAIEKLLRMKQPMAQYQMPPRLWPSSPMEQFLQQDLEAGLASRRRTMTFFAFSRDDGFANGLADYRDTQTIANGDVVLVRGVLEPTSSISAPKGTLVPGRIVVSPESRAALVPVVRLLEIERQGDATSRIVAGQARDPRMLAFGRWAREGSLEWLMRYRPPTGSRVSTLARYVGPSSREDYTSIAIVPVGESFRQTMGAIVLMPGRTSGDFADFRQGQLVEIDGKVSDPTGERLVIAGTRLQASGNAASAVTPEGRATPPWDLKPFWDAWQAAVNATSYAGELVVIGRIKGTLTDSRLVLEEPFRTTVVRSLTIVFDPKPDPALLKNIEESLSPGREVILCVRGLRPAGESNQYATHLEWIRPMDSVSPGDSIGCTVRSAEEIAASKWEGEWMLDLNHDSTKSFLDERLSGRRSHETGYLAWLASDEGRQAADAWKEILLAYRLSISREDPGTDRFTLRITRGLPLLELADPVLTLRPGTAIASDRGYSMTTEHGDRMTLSSRGGLEVYTKDFRRQFGFERPSTGQAAPAKPAPLSTENLVGATFFGVWRPVRASVREYLLAREGGTSENRTRYAKVLATPEGERLLATWQNMRMSVIPSGDARFALLLLVVPGSEPGGYSYRAPNSPQSVISIARISDDGSFASEMAFEGATLRQSTKTSVYLILPPVDKTPIRFVPESSGTP